MATTYDFKLTQGAEFCVTFEVKNDGGTPYNLSLINLNPSGVEGFLDSGRFKVTLYASQTQELPVCQGVYGIEIYSGSGVEQFVEKVVNGKFEVCPEVTNAGVIV